jgi:uncharacterized protein (UPF0254 family)
MVVVLVRKCVIPLVLDLRHVVILDDPVPDFFTKKDKDMSDEEAPVTVTKKLPDANCGLANLTEAMEKSDLWKSVKDRMTAPAAAKSETLR